MLMKPKFGIRTNRLVVTQRIYSVTVQEHIDDHETFRRLYPGWVDYSEERLFGPNLHYRKKRV